MCACLTVSIYFTTTDFAKYEHGAQLSCCVANGTSANVCNDSTGTGRIVR